MYMHMHVIYVHICACNIYEHTPMNLVTIASDNGLVPVYPLPGPMITYFQLDNLREG